MRSLLVAVGMVTLAWFAAAACDSETGCEDDFDCADALVCKVSTGVCEALVCKVDADCGAGRTCDDNACD